MSYNKVILLLGSNLFDRNLNLGTAQTEIENKIGHILHKSEIIETLPEGFESEHNFLNQILTIQTMLSPQKLLEAVKDIEKAMGRKYADTTQRYQDRLIDIDILCFNRIRFKSLSLCIPHHQVNSRKFVKNLMN